MVGKFITIEGTDGSGKTTMTNYIKEYLEKLGYQVIVTREPGGTPFSEKIRDLILKENIDSKTEALLFAVSRRNHLKNKILPELEAGKIVICDRFLDSSIAYQVYGRGLDEKDVLSINNYILDGFEPNNTIYYDVDIDLGLSRTRTRDSNNKMDNEEYNFYINVKKGYDKIAQKNKQRVITIDANKNLEEVKLETEKVLESLVEKWKQEK
ncbi:dTMP kinase [Gemella palaticanis]|uniref:Thymidylate kinase n=1 Tax=Gemelliphila palaticanis TaxID=81950 RepID=A0ABX2SY64_9BACL|nr:dTMP kinase [Gemella palaticanis]NYS47145.1 dTMP kinase [Gemella palaticanis]